MAAPLLDPSLYGFWPAAKARLSVLVFHVVTDVILGLVATLGIAYNYIHVSHPEYAVFLAAGAMVVNYILAVIWKTLQTINPEKINTILNPPTITEPGLAASDSGIAG